MAFLKSLLATALVDFLRIFQHCSPEGTSCMISRCLLDFPKTLLEPQAFKHSHCKF